MRRREFIAGTAATAALGFAQPIWAETNARSTDVKRIAFFYPAEIPPDNRARKAYFAELKRLGYIEGQNLIVERYAALGQPDRIGAEAKLATQAGQASPPPSRTPRKTAPAARR